MIGLLTIIIFLPAVAGLVTLLWGRKDPKTARVLGLGSAAAVFILSMIVLALYSYGIPGFQMTERADWASSFGMNYVVAIDGISLPLLLIATSLTLLATAGSWDLIKEREPE